MSRFEPCQRKHQLRRSTKYATRSLDSVAATALNFEPFWAISRSRSNFDYYERQVDMKNIAIVVPGSSQDNYDTVKEINAWPGVTANMLIQDADLEGYQLRTGEGGFLAGNDDIYSKVQPGEKLYAVLPMDVGR